MNGGNVCMGKLDGKVALVKTSAAYFICLFQHRLNIQKNI
jgi:hypothetical protein